MDITEDCQRLQQCIEQSMADFHRQADLNQLLEQLHQTLLAFIEQVAVSAIQELLYRQDFLALFKTLAAKSALRFHGYKPTSIQLLSGQSISIESPYFARAAPKGHRGRKRKKRTAKSGRHMALWYLGLIERCSGVLLSASVQAALLCPSFERAQRTLESFGIHMDIKTIRRLCLGLGDQAIEERQRITLSDADQVQGSTLLVCIDGGRLRERKPKPGRRPVGLKRQGYHTDWREPTQLVIQWLHADGTPCKETPPIYDATLAHTDEAFHWKSSITPMQSKT